MKKINQRLLASWLALFSVMLFVSGCEDGSYFDPNTKQIKSDFVSRIEAEGTDMRVYEFTPRSDPNRQCVFVAGTKKGAMVCWIKSGK